MEVRKRAQLETSPAWASVGFLDLRDLSWISYVSGPMSKWSTRKSSGFVKQFSPLGLPPGHSRIPHAGSDEHRKPWMFLRETAWNFISILCLFLIYIFPLRPGDFLRSLPFLSIAVFVWSNHTVLFWSSHLWSLLRALIFPAPGAVFALKPGR